LVISKPFRYITEKKDWEDQPFCHRLFNSWMKHNKSLPLRNFEILNMKWFAILWRRKIFTPANTLSPFSRANNKTV